MHIFLKSCVSSPLAVQGAAASLLPVCECLLPGGELDLCPAGPGRSHTLPVGRVSQRRQRLYEAHITSQSEHLN